MYINLAVNDRLWIVLSDARSAGRLVPFPRTGEESGRTQLWVPLDLIAETARLHNVFLRGRSACYIRVSCLVWLRPRRTYVERAPYLYRSCSVHVADGLPELSKCLPEVANEGQIAIHAHTRARPRISALKECTDGRPILGVLGSSHSIYEAHKQAYRPSAMKQMGEAPGSSTG